MRSEIEELEWTLQQRLNNINLFKYRLSCPEYQDIYVVGALKDSIESERIRVEELQKLIRERKSNGNS